LRRLHLDAPSVATNRIVRRLARREETEVEQVRRPDFPDGADKVSVERELPARVPTLQTADDGLEREKVFNRRLHAVTAELHPR
jgi:hypothetical protein